MKEKYHNFYNKWKQTAYFNDNVNNHKFGRKTSSER